MTWKQLKEQQEQTIVAAIRNLIGATEETQLTAEVNEQGCIVTLPQPPISAVVFEWRCDIPEDLICHVTSGTWSNDPPTLILTPSSITLSALTVIRNTIAAICAPTEEEGKDGGDVGEEHDNADVD